MGQTNEQWRHVKELPISELHGQVDSIQTSLKLLFTLQQFFFNFNTFIEFFTD
jgi:hypothetical protein